MPRDGTSTRTAILDAAEELALRAWLRRGPGRPDHRRGRCHQGCLLPPFRLEAGPGRRTDPALGPRRRPAPRGEARPGRAAGGGPAAPARAVRGVLRRGGRGVRRGAPRVPVRGVHLPGRALRDRHPRGPRRGDAHVGAGGCAPSWTRSPRRGVRRRGSTSTPWPTPSRSFSRGRTSLLPGPWVTPTWSPPSCACFRTPAGAQLLRVRISGAAPGSECWPVVPQLDISQRTDGPRCRTCIGCRERATKRELLRIVAGTDAEAARLAVVAPDPSGTAPGRGAHLHPTSECLALAERKRAFSRALRHDAGGPGKQGGALSLERLREHLGHTEMSSSPTRTGATAHEPAMRPLALSTAR